MREKERYLRWIGEYAESAEVGREAIKKLPRVAMSSSTLDTICCNSNAMTNY